MPNARNARSFIFSESRSPVAVMVRMEFAISPSGGAADSFTCAIAHNDNNTAVLDCLVEIKAPFNPDSATIDFAAALKSYGLDKTTADHYAAQWLVAALARHGITLTHSERDRSTIYLDTAFRLPRRWRQRTARASAKAGHGLRPSHLKIEATGQRKLTYQSERLTLATIASARSLGSAENLARGQDRPVK